MFDDLKIRNKLALLLAGPLVLVMLLASIGARSRQNSADDARQVETLVGVAQSDSDVVNALQQETLYATAYVATGRRSGRKDYTTARSNTDRVLATAVGRLQGGGGSASYRSAKGLALDSADKLKYIRSTVDQGYGWEQVVGGYDTSESRSSR